MPAWPCKPRKLGTRPRKRLGLPQGMWHPELVDKIQGYPKTQEIWQQRSDIMRQQSTLYHKEGICGRNGVPDGWGGKKQLINEIQTAAKAEAAVIVKKMIEEQVFDDGDPRATEALAAAVAIIRAKKFTPENEPVPLYAAKDVIAASRLVLDFTKSKPVQKSEVAVAKAEDFLTMLAGGKSED
jgi:hypothetical protein